METQLKIEVGKFYRTRNNKKARIYATDAGREFAVHGAIYNENINAWVPHRWHISGREYSQDKEFDFDLICEWEEPVTLDFDPTCLPAWANWIGMAEDKRWYFFKNKPKASTCFWDGSSNIYGLIPPEFAPKNFKLNWKSSLFSVEELKKEVK